MNLTSEDLTEYSVKQVADRLRERLKRYIEAQYHIRDIGVIEERRALLDEFGTISQQPYLETTPSYKLGNSYLKLDLPDPLGSTFTELASWSPSIGVYPRPYVHQAEALQSFFSNGKDLIVATGTGSGKTEAFLFPILGQLIIEGVNNPESFKQSGFRALLLYPMNALVSDQVSRLRHLFGDVRLQTLFKERYGRFPRFGMYTSRTPYPGQRSSKKDQLHMRPVLRYYLGLEEDGNDLDPSEIERRHLLANELKARGRWPAKDLKAFFGKDGMRWENRLKTQPNDRELLMRHEIQENCPDILVTNYSMLEYMLLRPIERPIFRQTAEWLAQDENNKLILVLDEAHLYRGVAGAEVGFLIRRLQSRLGIPRERMRCILTSASLGNSADAEKAVREFSVGLTGHPIGNEMPFHLIRGKLEEHPLARPGTPEESHYLAEFDLKTYYQRAENLDEAIHEVFKLAKKMGWQEPELLKDKNESGVIWTKEDLRRYLYSQLNGFGPLELLIQTTSGNATAFDVLINTLFPRCQDAERATETLLALGSYAHNGERVLLPTRVHLFFRGLPSLYACINPRCNQRRYKPGENLLLGRLYTEPRTHCDCDAHARVYELYTHRDCGAAFLRVFTRLPNRNFYWQEQGGNLEHIGDPLDEDFLLVEKPHPDVIKNGIVEPIWVDIPTGRTNITLETSSDLMRLFYRPLLTSNEKDNENGVAGFTTCPACSKDRASRKIMDLSTKGEQPFANLVREQLVLQPIVEKISDSAPNGGRKVLLFSDGRQKAARLARDLPREVEFDSFRQALVLAIKSLADLNQDAILDRRLYAAFVSVCSKLSLVFFESESQRKLLEAVQHFRSYYDGQLDDALEGEWNPTPPTDYRFALLRQLCDPYYSLNAANAAIVMPSRKSWIKLKNILRRGTFPLPVTFINNHLEAMSEAWVQILLDKTAFDPEIGLDIRSRVDEFFHPIENNSITSDMRRLEATLIEFGELDTAQVNNLRERLYEVITESDKQNSGAYLQPSYLALHLALEDTWYACTACGLLQHRPVIGHCVYCGSDRLEERPPTHTYMTARKGYFLEPLRAILQGDRPIHITAEEHTAQLSQRDAGQAYATTEEFELRFQDISLGPDKPPIDVLSCTTTMEVGIDIGSLTAIGLRNVPPQRENYQQRAGRSGRRGTAVSSVITYAQGGPHDNYYYQHPREIISGEPQRPLVKVDNKRLAQRHIHSFLIQTFFHKGLDKLSEEEERILAVKRTNLFSSLGTAAEFFAEDPNNVFSLTAFTNWINDNFIFSNSPLLQSIVDWLPDELCTNGAISETRRLMEKRSLVTTTATNLINTLKNLAPKMPRDVDISSISLEDDKEDTPHSKLLLDLLFDQGLLPAYAFPTDLCSFYVFEQVDGRVHIKERPQQGKDRALSEYAPGRLLVINKKTYRVGGLFAEGPKTSTPGKRLFEKQLGVYVYCPSCTSYVSLQPLGDGPNECPICKSTLYQAEFLDPPGFSPEKGISLNEKDREQEITYATSAQFPQPVNPEQFDWIKSAGRCLMYAHREYQKLVIVNRGPEDKGFCVCESCGAVWPAGDEPNSDNHERPFLVEYYIRNQEGQPYRCRGPLHSSYLYLGTTFYTDLLLLRIPINNLLIYDPRLPWLHDAIRSASEALALASSRHLDIDPGELNAGYRLLPSDDRRIQGYVDIYLFDTASGGAGYAAEASQALPDILDRTFDLLRNCPSICERSCTKCLRHYGNRFWHDKLDRHLGAQLLEYAYSGQVPTPLSIKEQANQLQSLQRYLQLEGWSSKLNENLEGVEVPLIVTLPSGRQAANNTYVAIGTYPALVNKETQGFDHPLYKLDYRDDIQTILIEDYIVSRDLPTAYHKVLNGIRK